MSQENRESRDPIGDAPSAEIQAAELPSTALKVAKAWTRADLPTLAATALGLVAALVPFLFMAWDRRVQYSVPLTLVALCFTVFGLLGALRSFDRLTTEAGAAALTLTAADLRVPALRLLASLLSTVFALRFAVSGAVPGFRTGAGFWITALSLWLAIEIYRFGRVLGAFGGKAGTLLSRYGFWVTLLSCLVHLPTLGSFGLIDPWETHYGEVAREILSRDDWISLWWAQDGWFWSKPISNFWMQALSFKLLGVGYMPGAMLSQVAQGRWPQPEWACRIGVFALTQLATYVLYRALVAPFGRLAAALGAAILTTCPYWFMLARQTMADMVYAAPLSAALGFLLMAFQTDPERRVPTIELRFGQRRFWVSSLHLALLVIAFTSLPQIFYLYSRNLSLHTGPELVGFRPHLDEFMQGSGGGNCGQAGNQACASVTPLYKYGQPALFGLAWTLVLGLCLWLNRHEQRLQRILFLVAWYATALAVMGKGAPGLVIPLATALVFPAMTGRFRDYLRLELPSLLLIVLCVALPWYVQMYMRHGWPFLDRLIMHDMVRRAFVHVHDTNTGDDTSFRYYIWQLGYGLFPWTGFAAAGLIWLGRAREDVDALKMRAGQFLLVWWLVAFGMFTITLTKFHHYILPLVPPTALLAGVFVAEYLSGFQELNRRQRVLVSASAALATLLLLFGSFCFFPGSMNGAVFSGELAKARPVIGGSLLGLGLVIAVLGFRNSRVSLGQAHTSSPMLGALAIAAVGPVLLSGRDLFLSNEGDVEGQVRLLHLFTYNYTRSWPEALNFKAVFLVFTLVAAAVLLLAALPRWRGYATLLFACCAVWFAVWCNDVYFVRVSPHWGQRETMLAYYQQRKDETEPLIAYQMNWKGENFYTGNRMATFVSSGAKFKSWIKTQREHGIRTFFVTTEHSRISGLKRELESPDGVELLTTKDLNDKFVLAKVVYPPLEVNGRTEAGAAEVEGEAAEKPGSLE